VQSPGFFHKLSDIQSEKIGAGTKIWQYCIVLPGAIIGKDCNICSHCFIENDVVVGDRVTVKNGVQLWDGLRIEDDVFIGPNVTFANDKYPRSKQHPEKYLPTIVKKGASIGANATILPGITIRENAMVASGAVVTQDVPEHSIVKGVPAKISGYTDTVIHPSGIVSMQSDEKLSGPVLYSLSTVRDIRGNLVAGEFPKELPFKPRRIFMVYDVPNSKVRGTHAHKECHQFLIAVHGTVTVILDNAKTREEYMLSNAEIGLYIRPGIWGIQYKYSKDAVLLVLASHRYNSDDYIRDYNTFIEWKKGVV
jgi:acetyltransferase-like isoleucine patch superfamily enzyme/dTDP-4-dehydrorhamnose 3,5-epimerase-like enzyme